MEGQNKRLFPRFSFSEPVGYGLSEQAFNGSLAGNISLGGISIKVQEFVAVGTILELQIHWENSPKVTWAKAQVVRVREVLADDCYEIGLKFIKDEASLRDIGEYVNSRRFEPT